ncbi:unnamed protein product [Rotaria magnacalcarata]|uniref:Uncharacterized protein n=2 Tax=Rotaria magnacalcarata TaxID=392030 RepID=A0A815YPL4_9BILA|nr:unnamed protein product [Rotaria magnacalcarata]
MLMACINNSFSSHIFVSDLPSYGLIGLICIGLVLYFSYIITYLRNDHLSIPIYINISQLFLFFVLLSPITFLIRPSASTKLVCPLQTFSLQIFPFFLLLGFNTHFVYQWLLQTKENSTRKTCLVSISSFLIFFLAMLIQTSIILIWFHNHHNYQHLYNSCTDECYRPLFLCSLAFNFFLLFLFSLQSSIRYHLFNCETDLIYLLISVLALCATIIWICLYLFIPLRSSLTFYMNNNYILAYGNLFLVYSFLGPLLFEQLFYHQNIRSKEHLHKPSKMSFKSLSLTKEQQRAFMAAYIKRNLTASCENLTTVTMSSPMPMNRQINQDLTHTCHSTLSVGSLCPTLASTISHGTPPKTLPIATTDTSSCGTLTSEYLLLSTSPIYEMK